MKRGQKEFSFSKRGISGIVVALILVLLALVAAGIVWFVIRNIVSEGTEGISLGEFLVDLEIKKVLIEGGNNLTVQIKRNPGKGDLSGINFIISNGTDTETIKKEVSLQELEEKSFKLTLQDIKNASSLTEVSIAPILKSKSGKDVQGDVTDIYLIGAESVESSGPSCGDGWCASGENCTTCETDCGACGDDTGTCGDGVCGTGENCNSCPSDCGTCPAYCGDGICDPSESCTTCETDCGACGCEPNCTGKVCGNDGCGGTCPPGCGAGYICNATWQCEVETSLNSGTILSVWPSGAVKYFDSGNLPKSNAQVTAYIGKYVKFTGTETRCLRITFAEYLSDPGYDKSYIRLESVASIAPGNNYEIWTSSTCGTYLP